jgi:hypothetical protein
MKGKNLYFRKDGQRQCRACMRERTRAYKRKRKLVAV